MSVKKILIYIEPHPLRNSFHEYCVAANFIIESFLLIDNSDFYFEWKVYSNKLVTDELTAQFELGDRIISPDTDTEMFQFSSLREWDVSAIKERQELVNGVGEISNFYERELARVRSFYPFDTVILWSENGAVRAFCEKNYLQVFHCELGPTRLPFPETFYVDSDGTNGAVSLMQYELNSYPEEKIVPADTWISLSAGHNSGRKSIIESLFDGRVFSPDQMSRDYIVIALQLADDLNTLSHSNFSSPKEFLEYIVPPLISFGFDVVIKGHPGAVGRPYNLALQLEALEYVQGLNGNVLVLDKEFSKDKFLVLLKKAYAVCSINSSVSFEALLLGTPGIVFGTAAYDVGGALKALGVELLQAGKISTEGVDLDKLCSILFRHYIHPYNPVVASKVFEILIRNFEVHMSGKKFIDGLIDNIDHGESFMDVEVMASTKVSAFETVSKNTRLIDSGFYGNIDEVLRSADSDLSSLMVSGWVSRGVGDKPVIAVALRVSDQLLSGFVSVADRPDVREAHPEIVNPCGFNVGIIVPSVMLQSKIELLFICANESFSYLLDLSRVAPYFISGHKEMERSSSIGIIKRFLKKL